MTRAIAGAFLALFLASAAGIAAAQTAPQLPEAPHTLDLTIQEEVKAAPDIAHISAGVNTRAITAVDALTLNAREMNAVMAALEKAGIEAKNIQTAGISLYPQYDYPEFHEGPRLTGYQASNSVNVTVHDLATLGKTIDALGEAGANQISGPAFAVKDRDAHLDKARAAAIRKAQRRAEIYAEAAGMKVKGLLAISESTFAAPAPPIPMMRTMAAEGAAAPTPVSPGEVGMTVTVNVRFELAPR